MKKFRFPLQKLRNWRQTRFETEEARLAGLLHQRQQIVASRDRLTVESEQALTACVQAAQLQAADLVWLDSYRRSARIEMERLTVKEKSVGDQIVKQRTQLLAARRDVLVLDNLKEQRHQQWRKEADHEQEEMVAELVVARWKLGGR